MITVNVVRRKSEKWPVHDFCYVGFTYLRFYLVKPKVTSRSWAGTRPPPHADPHKKLIQTKTSRRKDPNNQPNISSRDALTRPMAVKGPSGRREPPGPSEQGRRL
jgi:hypothetical protein